MRWEFKDTETNETWSPPINPDSMSSPLAARQAQVAHAVAGQMVVTLSEPDPIQWQFGGVIRTKQHHDDLERWAEKSAIIEITDHLQRTFRVLIESFEPTDRRPNKRTPWRLRYVMKTLILEAL